MQYVDKDFLVLIVLVITFSFPNSSMENVSKYSGSPIFGNSPVLSSTSASSSGSRALARLTRVPRTSDPEDCAQYGSVLLDMVTGTAHWSPEAPRRAITPDRQNIGVFQGRARHCKQATKYFWCLKYFPPYNTLTFTMSCLLSILSIHHRHVQCLMLHTHLLKPQTMDNVLVCDFGLLQSKTCLLYYLLQFYQHSASFSSLSRWIMTNLLMKYSVHHC